MEQESETYDAAEGGLVAALPSPPTSPIMFTAKGSMLLDMYYDEGDQLLTKEKEEAEPLLQLNPPEVMTQTTDSLEDIVHKTKANVDNAEDVGETLCLELTLKPCTSEEDKQWKAEERMKENENATKKLPVAESVIEKAMLMPRNESDVERQKQNNVKLPKAILTRLQEMSGEMKASVTSMTEMFEQKLRCMTELLREVPRTSTPTSPTPPTCAAGSVEEEEDDELYDVKEETYNAIMQLVCEVTDILTIYQDVLNDEHLKGTRMMEELREEKDAADIANHQLRSEIAELEFENSRLKSDRDEMSSEVQKLKQECDTVETHTISIQSTVDHADAQTQHTGDIKK